MVRLDQATQSSRDANDWIVKPRVTG